jgi:hypothetical protein
LSDDVVVDGESRGPVSVAAAETGARRVGLFWSVERKRKLKDGLFAISLANLFFIGTWFVMLYHVDHGYFNKTPVRWPSLLALAANMTWFAAAVWLLMRVWRRTRNRWFRLGLHGLLALCLVPVAELVRTRVFSITDYQLWVFFTRPLVAVTGSLLAMLAVWLHARLARYVAIGVGMLWPLGLWTYLRLFLLCSGVMHLDQHDGPGKLCDLQPVDVTRPRVLWMIWDELDYRLPFEARPAGLPLPEFDRLRQECVWASNAYPPQSNTVTSVPALLSGVPVRTADVASHSDLRITGEAGETALWSELPSVFDGAKLAGVNCAVAGWYHPYDRVFGRSLAFCQWYPHEIFEWTRSDSFSGSMQRQLYCLSGTFFLRYLHGRMCENLLRTSVELVTNKNYGLIYLHLPTPHAPGIYVPEKDKIGVWFQPKAQGYFNNIRLADRGFGDMRRAMESSGEWARTWVILSSDHSWRSSQVYDGKRDLRVPFAIRVPGETGELAYPRQLDTLATKDLVLAVLRGEITNRQGVIKFLDRH